MVDVDESTKKIVVQCETPVNGTADVYIDYSVDKKKNRSAILNIQRMLKVENTGTVYASGGSYYESNFLRSESAEYIPVSVVNGYGEVTLTSNPAKSTSLSLNQAQCDCIYTVMSDYLVLQEIQPGENYFSVANIEKNANAVNGITAVKFGENEYVVKETETTKKEIRIYVDRPVESNDSLANILFLQR